MFENVTLATAAVGVAVGLLAVYMLVTSGLATLLIVFTVSAILTAALELLVFIGLQLLLPALGDTPLFERIGLWALVLPSVVGLIAALNMWREMR